MHQEICQGRRGHPRNAPGLAEALRPSSLETLDNFMRKTTDMAEREVCWNLEKVVLVKAPIHIGLRVQVSRIELISKDRLQVCDRKRRLGPYR